jgi:predicted nucleic acid-binding protein
MLFKRNTYEYEEKLIHFYKKQTASDILNFIFYSLSTLLVTPYFQWNFITTDSDDNKFVDCAISANADYIVSNDKHFNILKKIAFPKVNVINIEQFKNMINQKYN